ncbi:glycosyltransferase family 4 protein [Leptospira stimsonii]|uniref:Glycosyl transferase n=1 Tax=Leptospira stimsonii TaxID=2202203 RepID=A0A8B3CQU0_9LEPT|nr:glycosyltransferase family 1 protein [Leptospira stimsonii]RHX86328.1 glycosyl transferase [Leptospira stimsonii]
MILGIDASNIRGGGGVTHLVELLKAADPEKQGFQKVLVWSGTKTIDQIEDKPWLEKIREPLLDRSLLFRVFWGKVILNQRLKQSKVDILFIPGGTYTGHFQPFVTMSQNLLPFDWKEIRRYGVSLYALRFLILFLMQSFTFRRSAGIIFLTTFAREVVFRKVKLSYESTKVVNHGINKKFFHKPKEQKKLQSYSFQNPFRILYVSFVGEYKHQWNVVHAVANLRRKGIPLRLDLIGSPDEKNAVARLKDAMALEDSGGEYIHYYEYIPYSEIEKKYLLADLFVFASSCETFGQIVTEAMAAGLPVACSNFSAMPEILRDAGRYFNPLEVNSIEQTLLEMIESKQIREESAKRGYALALEFSWKKAAQETFEFLQQIGSSYYKNSP